jgi:hypothetical protein
MKSGCGKASPSSKGLITAPLSWGNLPLNLKFVATLWVYKPETPFADWSSRWGSGVAANERS